MQSKISCFNKTIFLNNIKRFWPIWSSYLAILLLVVPFSIHSNYYGAPEQSSFYLLNSAVSGFALVYPIFAILSAVAVFSFLYTSKSAGFYNSLPINRPRLFAVQYFSGLFWLVAVHVITALVTALLFAFLRCGSLMTVVQWLGITILNCIFYYSFACFCAVLTGHGMVAIPLYGILNFCAFIVEYLVKTIITALTWGISFTDDYIFSFLSPVVKLRQYSVFVENLGTGEIAPDVYSFTYQNANGVSTDTFRIIYDGWLPLCLYALAGVALAAIAYFIFKKRHMETASDVVAVNILKPVFRYCMAFGCALCGTLVLATVFGGYGNCISILLYMTISAFIGYFGSEMLIQKAFKVFSRKRWIGYGVVCAVILLFVSCIGLDVFGIEGKVPVASDVSSVSLRVNDKYETSDPDIINEITDLHSAILERKDSYASGRFYSFAGYYIDDNSRGVNADIIYTLKNGEKLARNYSIFVSLSELETEGTVSNRLYSILNTPDAVIKRLGLSFSLNVEDFLYANLDSFGANGEYTSIYLSQDEIYELYSQCIIPDVKAGIIGIEPLIYSDKSNTDNPNFSINIGLAKDSSGKGPYFAVSGSESKTARYLQKYTEDSAKVTDRGFAITDSAPSASDISVR